MRFITVLISLLLVFNARAAITSPFLNTADYQNSIRLAVSQLPSYGGIIYVTRDTMNPATVFIPSNVQIVCLPGVTVRQLNPAVDVFVAVGATHFALIGCHTAGGHNALSAYNISDYRIEDNWFTGYSNIGIAIGRPATSGMIRHNRITNCAPGCSDAIFVEDNGGPLTIDSNEVDTSGAPNDGKGNGPHGIAVHTFAAGGSSDSLRLSNNRITHYGGNFAIEVGAFGTGALPSGVVITGNHLKLPVSNNGGISLGSVQSAVISDNDLDLSGLYPQIDAIEIVNSPGTRIHGNYVSGLGPNGRALALDSTSGAIVTGNQFYGVLFIVNSGTAGNVNLSDNLITGNLIQVPAGSGWLYGIWMQCNVLSCLAVNNRVINNRIVGIGLDSSVGIYLEADSGAITGTWQLDNVITGFTTATGQSSGVVTTVTR